MDTQPKDIPESSKNDVGTDDANVSTAGPDVNNENPTTTNYPHNNPFDIFGGGLHNMPVPYDVPDIPHIRINKDHPIENVIGNMNTHVRTRRQFQRS